MLGKILTPLKWVAKLPFTSMDPGFQPIIAKRSRGHNYYFRAQNLPCSPPFVALMGGFCYLCTSRLPQHGAISSGHRSQHNWFLCLPPHSTQCRHNTYWGGEVSEDSRNRNMCYDPNYSRLLYGPLRNESADAIKADLTSEGAEAKNQGDVTGPQLLLPPSPIRISSQLCRDGEPSSFRCSPRLRQNQLSSCQFYSPSPPMQQPASRGSTEQLEQGWDSSCLEGS